MKKVFFLSLILPLYSCTTKLNNRSITTVESPLITDTITAITPDSGYVSNRKATSLPVVRKVKNRAKLLDNTGFDHDLELRKLEVEKLENEGELMNIASFDDDVKIRKLAVQKLKTEANLMNIASFDDDKEVRKLAVQKLKLEKNLISIANFDQNKAIRKLASNRILKILSEK